jgi:hypothetical protein
MIDGVGLPSFSPPIYTSNGELDRPGRLWVGDGGNPWDIKVMSMTPLTLFLHVLLLEQHRYFQAVEATRWDNVVLSA